MYLKTSLIMITVLTAGLVANDEGSGNKKPPAANPKAETGQQDHAKRAHVDLVIYSCTVDREKAHLISRQSLSDAWKSSTKLYDALKNLGETEYVQRISRPIAFSGETYSVTSGASVPFVRGTSLSRDGHTTASIEYEEIGSVTKVSGTWQQSDLATGTIQIELEIKELRSSDISLGNGVKAPVITQIEFSLDTEFELNKGQLFIVGGPPTADENTVSVLVGRLEVSH